MKAVVSAVGGATRSGLASPVIALQAVAEEGIPRCPGSAALPGDGCVIPLMAQADRPGSFRLGCWGLRHCPCAQVALLLLIRGLARQMLASALAVGLPASWGPLAVCGPGFLLVCSSPTRTCPWWPRPRVLTVPWARSSRPVYGLCCVAGVEFRDGCPGGAVAVWSFSQTPGHLVAVWPVAAVCPCCESCGPGVHSCSQGWPSLSSSCPCQGSGRVPAPSPLREVGNDRFNVFGFNSAKHELHFIYCAQGR